MKKSALTDRRPPVVTLRLFTTRGSALLGRKKPLAGRAGIWYDKTINVLDILKRLFYNENTSCTNPGRDRHAKI